MLANFCNPCNILYRSYIAFGRRASRNPKCSFVRGLPCIRHPQPVIQVKQTFLQIHKTLLGYLQFAKILYSLYKTVKINCTSLSNPSITSRSIIIFQVITMIATLCHQTLIDISQIKQFALVSIDQIFKCLLLCQARIQSILTEIIFGMRCRSLALLFSSRIDLFKTGWN